MISKPSENLSFFNGYKVKLYPTEEQKVLINKNIRLFRAVYNLALEIQNRAYAEEHRHIQYFEMTEILADYRNNDPSFAWLKDIQIGSIRRAIANLEIGFDKFFNKITKYPKFKSRKHSKKSFSTRSERTNVYDNMIYIPGVGRVDAKNHHIPSDKRLHQTVVTFDGYDYWFSCSIAKECDDFSNISYSNPIGIDVGLKNMITTSDGEYYHLSDTSKLERRLARQQRKLSKDYTKYIAESKRTRTKYEDIEKSKNHFKRLEKMHKTQSKITHKRLNDINAATKQIVNKYPSAIIIEDISVKRMVKDAPNLRKNLPNMFFYEIHRQLTYKAKERGIEVIKADRYYPSTKKCSNCGKINNVGRNRVYKCSCGLMIDRDLNAALNLRDLAYNF